jgi:prokaryotic ubiquitin-like protein Pup
LRCGVPPPSPVGLLASPLSRLRSVAKQEQVKKVASEDKAAQTAHSAGGDNKQELKDEMDALLDEIDAVLEENAEEFVKGYVQKGGE